MGETSSHLHCHRWLFAHPTDQSLGRCDWQSPGGCSHHNTGTRSRHSDCSRKPGASTPHSQSPVVADSGLLGEGQVEVTARGGLPFGASLSASRPLSLRASTSRSHRSSVSLTPGGPLSPREAHRSSLILPPSAFPPPARDSSYTCSAQLSARLASHTDQPRRDLGRPAPTLCWPCPPSLPSNLCIPPS